MLHFPIVCFGVERLWFYLVLKILVLKILVLKFDVITIFD